MADGVQCPRGRFGEGVVRPGRCDLQGYGEREGLFVVEQERRKFGPGGEPVAAVGSLCRIDGVAELAEAVDITAHGAQADPETVGQQCAGPVAVRL